MKKFSLLLFLCFVNIPFPTRAEQVGEPPGHTLQEFQRGQLAAQQGQWDLALDHFDKAQKEEPLLAAAYFNLGLAYRNSGSPVLASLWFRAFLEAEPGTEEADQIGKEINRLELQAEAKARQLLELALSSAEQIPEEYADERQQDLEGLALIEAISGRTDEAVKIAQKAGGKADKSFYLRRYGESLAVAHDYQGAEAVLKQITEPDQAERLLAAIANYQILRSEREEARRTLHQMAPSPERAGLLNQLVALYTRELDARLAEPLLEEAAGVQEKLALQTTLLSGYLKAGLLDQAKRTALEIQRSDAPAAAIRLARVLGGEGERVLGELEQMRPDPKNPWQQVSESYTLTLALAWMGDLGLARRGCDLSRQFVAGRGEPGTGDFAAIACTWVASEEGKMDEVFKGVAGISSASQNDFSVSLFWRLAHQKRYGDIQKLIDFIRSPAVKATLLQHLAGRFKAEGKGEEAGRFNREALEIAVSFNLGFVLRKMALSAEREGDPELAGEALRTERTLHWIFLAREYQTKEALVNLPSYLDHHQSDDLRLLTASLRQAADDWASAVALIRGIEERHERP